MFLYQPHIDLLIQILWFVKAASNCELNQFYFKTSPNKTPDNIVITKHLDRRLTIKCAVDVSLENFLYCLTLTSQFTYSTSHILCLSCGINFGNVLKSMLIFWDLWLNKLANCLANPTTS